MVVFIFQPVIANANKLRLRIIFQCVKMCSATKICPEKHEMIVQKINTRRWNELIIDFADGLTL